MWVLLALLPTGGLSLCLGDDGHLGFGQLSSEQEDCPCLAENWDQDNLQVSISADLHPSCADLGITVLEFFRGRIDSDAAACLPQLLAIEMGPVPVLERESQEPGWSRATQVSCPILRQKRTAVLLI